MKKLISAALIASVTLLLGACAGTKLDRLLFKGPELHPALSAPSQTKTPRHELAQIGVTQNPQHSTAPAFIKAVARLASRGQLTGQGIHSALYAHYYADHNLELYGFAAESGSDADRIEQALRLSWAEDISLERARVYRDDRLLLVIWTDGITAEVWQAVNSKVAERLIATGWPK
ncbi:hypothetical protein [Arsukibacterium sp.]|uniref:hypothetical protein n=1 Tax=Arsukibacterium sp. TaxID=1977258 RepID=UPI00299E6657|nr:hypothetical protein [Arsukibacterium sp.]MDX1678374.1 hypothetical protein [Arsukibacterium sp.]